MPDILGIGSSGLTAYRKLLETVGSNIVNANTEGYVRRDVSLQATGESTMLPTARPTTSGSGVLIDSVRRGTDAFLQAQTYTSNSLAKQASTYADSLSQLEKAVFSSSSNLSTEVQNFYSTFSQLASAPTSTATRLTLLDAGERVASTFRATAQQIQTSQQSVESALGAALDQVNVLATQLARLNTEIARTASGGQKPNDLLDQRDKLLGKLSDLTGFTMVEAQNGSVTLYLGDTASGQKLIGTEGAHQLGLVKNGSRLDIAFDPNTSPSITSQIKTGTIAGLMDFRREANILQQNIDRLAVGLTSAVNSQHKLGVDQDGNPGKDLFSADSLKSVAGSGNTGLTKMNVDVTTAAQLTGATYTARYDAAKLQWTVTSSDGRSASGEKSVLLDGVTFGFEGTFSSRDIFTAEPLKNAAAGMRFLRTTPSELAAALPLYVDQGTGNQGSGVLAVTNRNTAIPPAPLPNAADIFKGTNLGGVDFLRNGAAFLIKAGTGPSTLTSLGTLPSLHFNATARDILALNNDDGNGQGGLTLNLNNDGTQKTLSLSPRGAGMEDIARAINEAAANNGAASQIYASVSSGALSISAIGDHTISNGSLSGIAVSTMADGTTQRAATSINADTEKGTSAAKMRLFTRDGRQLSGPLFESESEAAAFITTANGFLSEAFYRPPTANAGYRSLNLTTANDLLSRSLATTHAATINVAQSPYNLLPVTQGQGSIPGAVYAMDIAGLPPVRLAGDAIAGRDATGIANSLFDQINSYATRRTWMSAPVTIQPDGPPQRFTVTVDGEDHQVTFVPGKRPADAKPNETYLNTGTFSVSGGLDLKINLVPDSDDATKVRVTISAPQVHRTTAPSISISADAEASNTLGLSATPARTMLTAAQPADPSILDGSATGTITLLKGNQQITLTIDNNEPPKGDVTWTIVDGRVSIVSTDPNISILSDTTARRDGAAKLGFLGTDLNLSRSSQITGSTDLVPALLQARKPKLHITGATIGDKTITIDAVAGQSGGISWKIKDGKLELSPADSTMRVSASGADSHFASMLGFTGLETPSNGKLVSTQNVDSALLETEPVTVTLADGSKLEINGTSGIADNGNWQVIDGRLRISSPSLAASVSANNAAAQQVARSLGFFGPDRDTPTEGAITAAATLDSALLAARAPKLRITTSNGAHELTISGPSGTTNYGVSWSVVDGRLQLKSDDPSLAIDTTNGGSDLARALGFGGRETPNGSGALTASNLLSDSMLATSPATLFLADGSSITVSAPNGRSGDTSWALVDGRLKISGPTLQSGLQRLYASYDEDATSLGFNGNGRDDLSLGTQISISSTALDEIKDVVDTSASRSIAASKINIGSVLPEDMIVQIDNPENSGLRRIAAQLGDVDPSKIPFPSITVKILPGNQLDIIDRKSGVSLARRNWMPDKDVSYLGLSFQISGNAQPDDVFDISNDSTRAGDSRNAQAIFRMSTASIFGDHQGSFQDVYTFVAGTMGSTVNSAEMTASSTRQSASDLKSAYEAKTGVNLDTEASDLIRFQQAYQAAAQVVSSARAMFETILRSF